MDKLENNNYEEFVKNYLWGISDKLRGSFDPSVWNEVVRDFTFLKLLDLMKESNAFNINDYIKSDLFFRKNVIVEDIYTSIDEDELIKDLVSEGFIKFITDYPNEFELIVNRADSYDFGIINNYSELFMEVLYQSERRLGKASVHIITPKSINKLIAELVKDKKIISIYDGAIGAGCLVSEIAKKHEESEIYGQDIYEYSIKICKMNLILMGRFDLLSNIRIGNTISDPCFIEDNKVKQFDLVVSQPPFSIRDFGYDDIKEDKYNRFYRGLPPKSNADFAFLTHYVESIKEKGLGIILALGRVLFAEGADKKLRSKFIEENIIDTVMTFSTNMLYGTAIPINIIIFNKNKKDSNILFIDASKECKKGKMLTILTDENIAKIVDTYNKREAFKGFSNLVTMEEVISNDYNLSVQRYIETEDRKEIDIDAVTDEIEKLKGNLYKVQNRLDELIGNK